MRTRSACSVLVLVACSATNISGQSVSTRPRSDTASALLQPTYSLEAWTTANGLPQDTVTAIESGRDGYMWLGTFGGLARFDGVRFRTYTIANSPGLPSDRIVALEEDGAGRLWIGTERHGAGCFEDGRFWRLPGTLELGTISDIVEDAAGDVWVAGDGLMRYSATGAREGQRVDRPDRGVGVTFARVFDLELDAFGELIVATDTGLLRAFDGELEPLEASAVLRGVEELAVDDMGRLWMFAPEAVACRDADGRVEVLDFAADGIVDAHFDRAGHLLMCTWTRSHARSPVRDGDRWILEPDPMREWLLNKLGSGIRVLHEDDAGNLWIGCNGSGLVRASHTSFVRLEYEHGMPAAVRELAVARDGVWLHCSEPALLHFDGVSLAFRPIAAPLGDSAEFATVDRILGVSASGELFVTTSQGMIARGVQQPAWLRFEQPLRGCAADHDGVDWFGGVGGRLHALQDGAWRTEQVPGVASPTTARFVDADNAVWFTYADGFGRRGPQGYQTFDLGEGLAGAELRAMAQDRSGSVWLASYGHGLLRWRDDQLTRYGHDEGLMDVALGGILLHGDRLCVNSNKGVMLLSLSELDAVARGERSRASCRVLRTGEGNGPDVAEDSMGRMWFPTVRGVAVVDPALLRSDLTAPRVRIEEVTADGVTQPVADRVVVSPGVGDLEIGYTAFSFSAPHQVRFRYRLVGYNDEWVDARGRRVAYFTKVPPGSYEFEVIAANADGVWNASGARLALDLRPHFYETPWFRMSVLLGLVAGIVWLYRGRMTGIQRHNLELRREIDERERVEQERRALEASLRESKRLEAVGRLAGGIAHDFNNVLTAILGRSELLELDLRDRPDDRLGEHVEHITSCARRAAALTHQLLAFSRQQVLQPIVLTPEDVIAKLEPMLRQLLPENVELRVHYGSDTGRIRVDPTQLEQVVMNLVLNARDALPAGGSIAVETARVQLDAEYVATHPQASIGEHVMIAVADNGHGIGEQVLPHVFEPFFTTKEKSKGTGLGLASVHGIVTQSEGHILVYSEVDVGTTFKVYFPVVRELARADPLDAVPAPLDTVPSATLLVCEDDAAIRSTMAIVLRARGFRVIEASRPAEAITAARLRGSIDLLITDVVMPEMNGRELAGELAHWRPDLPVLYVSGYTSDARIQQGVSDRDLHYLEKPFTPAQLVAKVDSVLRAAPHSESDAMIGGGEAGRDDHAG